MGTLECELKTKDKRRNLQKITLSIIFTAGALGVAAVAPNVFSAIKQFESPNKRKKFLKYSIDRSFARLKEKGLIVIIEENGKKIVKVTPKGENTLDFLERHNYNLKKPKNWDGRWRVVIFDINEKRKKIREQLRYTLHQIGFVKLQNSVWIYPYDCEDLISLLKNDFNLSKDVLYMIVEKLEGDWGLRKTFGFTNSSGRKS